MQIAELLEAAMIISFGISWPLSIIRSYRSRSTKGKSIFFSCFIQFGYICGIASKLMLHKYKPRVLFLHPEHHDGHDRHFPLFPQPETGKEGGNGRLIENLPAG